MTISITAAAKLVGLSARRTREICAEHEIGELLSPRARMLDDAALTKLRRVVAAMPGPGPRPKKRLTKPRKPA